MDFIVFHFRKFEKLIKKRKKKREKEKQITPITLFLLLLLAVQIVVVSSKYKVEKYWQIWKLNIKKTHLNFKDAFLYLFKPKNKINYSVSANKVANRSSTSWMQLKMSRHRFPKRCQHPVNWMANFCFNCITRAFTRLR